MSINQGEANFSPNEERKSVFARKTFLFSSSKQMKRTGLAVTLAGMYVKKDIAFIEMYLS